MKAIHTHNIAQTSCSVPLFSVAIGRAATIAKVYDLLPSETSDRIEWSHKAQDIASTPYVMSLLLGISLLRVCSVYGMQYSYQGGHEGGNRCMIARLPINNQVLDIT